MANDAKPSPERAADEEELRDDEIDEEENTEVDEEESEIDEETGADINDEDDGEDDEDAKIEARARKMGWVPEDEWRGKPSQWRPAREFLQRASANKSVMDERFTEMERRHAAKLEEIQRKLDESTEVLGELHKSNKTAERRGYERARREIEDELKRAEEEEDVQGFKAARQKLDELEEENQHLVDDDEEASGKGDAKPKGAKDEAKVEIDPIVREWQGENKWIQDPELYSVASAIHMRLQREKPGLSLRENLDEVTDEVKARYPEKFRNRRRDVPSSVSRPSGGRQGNGGQKGRTYADLPAEAKAACDKFCRTIPGYTKKEYLESYEWSN